MAQKRCFSFTIAKKYHPNGWYNNKKQEGFVCIFAYGKN